MEDELERIKMKKLAEMMSRKDPDIGTRQVAGKPVIVTDLDFERFIATHPLAVIDFWAEWCAPCRLVAPVVEELARKYAGKVAFGKLNVDENPLTATKFSIMSIPTLLVLKDGEPVDFIIGAVPKRTIESKIQQYV